MSDPSIHLMVTENPVNGDLNVHFTGLETEKEVQNWISDAGGDEIVRAVVRYVANDTVREDGPAVELLRALGELNHEEPNSAAQILEKHMTDLFKAGVAYGFRTAKARQDKKRAK